MKENLLAWMKEGSITIPAALLSHYKKMNLNEQELTLLLHVISFLEKGNEFPTPAELSARMTISATECTDMLRRLVQKGFISIIDGYSDDGIRFEKYSLEPLWEKLIEQFLIEQKQQKSEIQHQEETDLYTIFEREFGRPLSPFEIETLNMWLDDDHHDPVIIKAALREAVISGKLNFRYIDRILFEWKKNGIKTIEQAKSHGKKFRQFKSQRVEHEQEQSTKPRTIPLYNWLEQ